MSQRIDEQVNNILTIIGDDTDDALDELVHASFSMVTSNTNNEGTPAQVRVLLEHGYTVEEILTELAK